MTPNPNYRDLYKDLYDLEFTDEEWNDFDNEWREKKLKEIDEEEKQRNEYFETIF